MRRVVVLGPQRHVITVTEELKLLGLSGRIATITAGWQERESEDDELSAALGNRAVNLRLHARTDAVFAQDRQLFSAHRRRQDNLRQLQDIYRMRLDHLMASATVLMSRAGPAELLEPERIDTIEQLRALDAHHLRRIRDVHEAFEIQELPGERRALAQHRAEVQGILEECDAVAIAGGHVSTLIGRMRLLDVAAGMTHKPILAWSAGAMVLTDRVVAFHDRPPEGAGNPEILDVGLGLAPGIVALPHATTRLKLDDVPRMALFSRRFSPSDCICLDAGNCGRLAGRHWDFTPGTLRLDASGFPVPASAEAA